MGEIFDHAAAQYDKWYETEIGSLVHEIEKELVFDLLKPEPGQIALDVGCGTGHYSLELARKGLTVYGMDISREMLSQAKNKSVQHGLAVNWLVGDAQKIPSLFLFFLGLRQ